MKGISHSPTAAAADRIRDLERQVAAQEEELRLAALDRDLLRGVLECLRPRMPWEDSGMALCELCLRSFQLSGFYLARADWSNERILFPFFHEAGRARTLAPIPLSLEAGLTGRTLLGAHPVYLPNRASCEAHGMRLTDAEQQSRLTTHSWFGVPLCSADPGRPAGLMGFHAYQDDAFSPQRRELMATVAALTALHLP